MMNELQVLERQIQFQGLDYRKYKNFDFRKHGVTINYDFIKEILTNQYLTSQHFLFFMNVFSHYFDNKLVYLDPYMFSQDYMPELVTGFVFKNNGFKQIEEEKPQQIFNQQEQLKSSDNSQIIEQAKPQLSSSSQIPQQQLKQNNQKSQNGKQNYDQLYKVQQNQIKTKGQKKEYQNNTSLKINQNNDKKIQNYNQTQSAIITDCQSEGITSKPPQSLILQKPKTETNNLIIDQRPQYQQQQQANIQQMVEQSIKLKQLGQTQIQAEQQQCKIPDELLNNQYFQINQQLAKQNENNQLIQVENQKFQQDRSGKIIRMFKELKSYYNFKQNPFQETGVSFIPINITNSHWICSIIFSDKQIIQYCDSLNNRDIRIEEGLLQLANYQGQQINWKFFYESPKQSNNYDCGVFCMRALYQVLRSKQPIQKNDYNQRSISQFRQNLAKLSIITSQIDITQQQVIQILEQQ